MRILGVVVAATGGLAACMSTPATDPTLDLAQGPWFVGEPQTVHVEWPTGETCNSSGWDCESGPLVWFQIDKVTCTGCTATGVPIGQQVGNATSFDFVATTTDAIALEVDVSSGGDTRTLTATGSGDRELALVADCELVYASHLGDSELPTEPCGATRSADQAVVVDWYIQTLRGERVPFCPDDASDCGPDDPRKTSQIELTPAPQMWWGGTVPVYTSLAASAIAMTVPLADGTPSSATIAVPPLP